MPDRFVTLTMSSEPSGTPPLRPDGVKRQSTEQDQMVVFGEDLVHDQIASKTVLQGSPLFVLRERNVLEAGVAKPRRSGTLVIEPGPAPEKKPMMTVLGPGHVEMYDAAAEATTLQASWQTSLHHTKEKIDGREVDLLTFTEAAKFEDKKADYWLKGNVLKLWMDGQSPDKTPKPTERPTPKPTKKP